MGLPKAPSRTTPNFAFSTLDRAISEGLARREFGRKEIETIVKFFSDGNLVCVYCGSPDVKRWDHIVPITNGGDTVVGNIAPACQICDDSKQDSDFAEWMQSKSECSPKSRGVTDIEDRIKKIKKYATHFGYNHRTVEQRLNQTELAKLDNIHSDIDSLKKKIHSFIGDFRKRNNLK